MTCPQFHHHDNSPLRDSSHVIPSARIDTSLFELIGSWGGAEVDDLPELLRRVFCTARDGIRYFTQHFLFLKVWHPGLILRSKLVNKRVINIGKTPSKTRRLSVPGFLQKDYSKGTPNYSLEYLSVVHVRDPVRVHGLGMGLESFNKMNFGELVQPKKISTGKQIPVLQYRRQST